MNKFAILALIANLSLTQASEIDVDMSQSSNLKSKLDAEIESYLKLKQENSSTAEWSFLQNMAKMGAFFSKPGLLGPDLEPKKVNVINVSESLQSATLLQVESDLDKKHKKKKKQHMKKKDSKSVDSESEDEEEKELDREEATILAKKAALRKKLAKKQKRSRERQEDEERNSAVLTRKKALAKFNKHKKEIASSGESESSDEEVEQKQRYSTHNMNDRQFRIQPTGDASRTRKSPAESTGNLMHGPKSDSFAFHISKAEGTKVHKGKHHVGAGALKHRKARKENLGNRVSESLEEKTWQPVSTLQVSESKPFNGSKLVQQSGNNVTQPNRVESKKIVLQKVNDTKKAAVKIDDTKKANATLAQAPKLKPLGDYFKNAQKVAEAQKPMIAAQKPEKLKLENLEEDISSEMAQHKAEIHTSSKVLTKEDKEEMQLQKEVSDIDF